jgi:sarcosine oxidase subunit beta
MMAEQADVIIIGAGIIGAATAFEMAKAGKRTLSVDKNPVAGYGPTSASCAIIRVHYSTLEGTAFAYEGYFYWRDWAQYLEVVDERGLANFREVGCMVLRTPHNDHLARQIDACDKLNIPYEIWDGEQIRAKLPVFNLDSYFPPRKMTDDGFGEATGKDAIKSAVWWPTAGYVTDPQLATHNLQVAAQAKGAQFLFGRQVVQITQTAGRVSGVLLDDGTVCEAPVVINAAGPHSARVNEMAGVLGDMLITTRALKQEVVHVPAPEGFDFYASGTVVSDGDIGCYSRPEHGNNILVGSEDPACDPREYVNPDDYDQSFSDQWTTQAQRYAQRVQGLGIPNRMSGVVSLYDVTDDWIPIYDRSSLDGFYMAIGTSGNQFKNAPIAGKMMNALVDYCEAGNDHDNNPLSFNLPYIDQNIDVSHYSRKRKINPDSSFSVLG